MNAEDIEVGNRIDWQGTIVTVTDIEGVPLTEAQYYGPAPQDSLRMTIEYDDGRVDEIVLFESDEVAKEGECLHLRAQWQQAEPQVGISTPYFECQDCGECTSEYTDEVDAERDDDGYVNVQRWREPVWES